MNSHTPGPWTTDQREHDTPYQDIKIKREHRSIATVWIDDAPVPDFNNEQIANAKLIAAAPDLLAACESWLCWFEQCAHLFDDLHVDEGAQMVIEQMKAAVAKAGGVSHE